MNSCLQSVASSCIRTGSKPVELRSLFFMLEIQSQVKQPKLQIQKRDLKCTVRQSINTCYMASNKMHYKEGNISSGLIMDLFFALDIGGPTPKNPKLRFHGRIRSRKVLCRPLLSRLEGVGSSNGINCSM